MPSRPVQSDDFRDPSGDLGLRDAGHDKGQRDIAPDRLGGEQIEVLENHAEAPAKRNQACLIERGDVLSVHDYSSGAWALEAIDRPQKARLAGAASADDAEYRSARIERSMPSSA